MHPANNVANVAAAVTERPRDFGSGRRSPHVSRTHRQRGPHAKLVQATPKTSPASDPVSAMLSGDWNPRKTWRIISSADVSRPPSVAVTRTSQFAAALLCCPSTVARVIEAVTLMTEELGRTELVGAPHCITMRPAKHTFHRQYMRFASTSLHQRFCSLLTWANIPGQAHVKITPMSCV